MNEADEDFYTLLGIDPKADIQTIRSAYRKLARELHPDVCEDEYASRKFNRLNDAYQILSDEKKRKQYDTIRAISFGLPFENIRKKFSDPNFHREILKKVSTGLATAAGLFRKKKVKPGRDMRIAVDITFAESFTGKQVELEFGKPINCIDCRGSGFSQIEPCLTCNGEGRLHSAGFPGLKKRCPRCDGKGWKGIEACSACENTGRIIQPQKIKLQIPAGVNDKQKLRVKGMGEGAKGIGEEGKSGDLIVVVNVLPHPSLKRSGSDIKTEISVPFKIAALGGRVEVELPQGPINLEIPQNSWDGRLLRLIGSGFPDSKTGSHGDGFFKISLIPPSKGNEKEIFSRYIIQVRGPEDIPDDLLKADLEGVFAS